MGTSVARRHWGDAILGLVVLITMVTCGIPALRHGVLRRAGWALVANDAIAPADIIVLAVDAPGSGTLEAADLVHGGVAAKVAVFADAADTTVENEFLRRGVPYEGGSELSIRELSALDVTNVEQIPGYVGGSEDEGPTLAEWCGQHRFRSVVVVSTPDHSRRLRRLLRRAMKGHQTRVMVRAAHYSSFEPDRWWESHSGMRTEIEEGEKLLLDIVRHPIS